MTSTNLFSNKSPQTQKETSPSPTRKRRFPSWLLPAVLLLAFAGVFVGAFADRLVSSREVLVTPAILLSDIEQEESAPVSNTETTAGPEGSAVPAADYSGAMLFQAGSSRIPFRFAPRLWSMVSSMRSLFSKARR